MRVFLILITISISFWKINGQETFPINGIENTFQPIYAFTNAKIIVSPDIKLNNGILLIQGDKIIDVDSNINIPKGAIIRNLDGAYIYPSFIDLYSTYGLNEKSSSKAKKDFRPQYKSKKIGAYHWNEAIHPEINASDKFITSSKDAKKYLNNGFGSVLTHFQDGIMRGTGTFVLLSKQSPHNNMIIKDAASFYSFNKGTSKQKYPTSLMGSIALIRQTLLDAEWYGLQNEQTNISYNAINNQTTLPKIFSINHELDFARAYNIGDEFEIDFIIKGNGKEYSEVDNIKMFNLPIIIPINFPKAYDVSNPETSRNITLKKLKEWEIAPYNPYILSKNNIPFCITSSGSEDKEFLKNLKTTIKKGLSKDEALKSLTTRPASLININDKIGTLEAGKIANFFISSNDIFENGEIYENWTAGEQHIINKKSEFDIRGYYTFNSKEFGNELVIIEGSKIKPQIKFNFLDSTTLITNLSNNNIVFSLSNATFRASGKFNNDIITGKYQNEQGAFYEFTMKRDSIYKEKEDSFILDVKQETPSIWYPNKAYGFEDLPSFETIIFKNATVWTNEKEGIIMNTDVIINNGKIVGIGTLLNPKDVLKEENYTVIDASELHLTSGIIDEHSHIAISKGVNEASQSSSAEVRIGDVINCQDHNIYRQLAGGTVAAQLLHGSANPIGGQSAIVKLRWGESSNNMKIDDAKPFIKFALGENVKQSNWGDFERIRFPQTRMGVEQIFYEYFYKAKEYQKKWENYNKLSFRDKKYTIPPREDLELEALVEILNKKRFITCHSYVQSEINMLMHVADSMGFYINTFTHILEGYKIADKMREHGAGGSTFSDWWAYKFEVNDAIPYNASLLYNKGIVTAINSDDAEMGRRLNQEAAKAIKYGGTSEEEAWKMVTLNPAKLLHLDERMGSIKVGKDADIVLWDNNPLSIYSKVQQTYVDGKLMFDIEFDKKLRDRDLAERMRIIKLMAEDKNKNKQQPPYKIKEKLYHCCKHRSHNNYE